MENFTPMPYFQKTKLIEEQVQLKKQIQDETNDLYHLVYRKSFLFKSKSVFEFYSSGLDSLIDKLHTLRSNFEHNLELLFQSQFKFLCFVIPEDRAEILKKKETPNFNFDKSDNLLVTVVENKNTEKNSTEIDFFNHKNGPEYLALEIQSLQAQVLYGKVYAELYSNQFSDNQEHTVNLSSTHESINLSIIKQTLLGSLSRFKIILSYFILLAGISVEFFIYSKILNTVFEFDGYEAYFTGATVALLGKVLASLLHGAVLEFLKHQSNVIRFFKIKINRFFFFLFVLVLLYSACVGCLFYHYKTEEKQTTELVLLQQENQSIQDNLEIGAITPEESKKQIDANNKKAATVQDKLSENDSVIAQLTIIFSGLIILLCSASLFALTEICSTAFGLQKKVEKLSWKICSLEGQFNSCKSRLKLYRNKTLHIIGLEGQLQFLQRISYGTPREVLFQKNETSILPLNKKTGTTVPNS